MAPQPTIRVGLGVRHATQKRDLPLRPRGPGGGMKTELERLEAQLRQHIEGYPPGAHTLRPEGVLILHRIFRLKYA